MDLLIAIVVIIISSIAIYFAAKRFAESSSKIGDYFNLPRSVKGATFDAISSSLPELLVALYAVIIFNKFEVGVGTIAGSALFNLLIIPGICVLISPVVFKVSKNVISRDALFYLIAVFALVILVMYFKVWGLVVALILLTLYLFYVREVIIDTKQYIRKKKAKGLDKRKPIGKELIMGFLTVALIGIFTFFLTDASINLAEILNVSPIIIAFTITAAATSVPDTVISVANAKKGDITDATSNVFGSNIFDIFVGLGLPLLMYSTIKGGVEMVFENTEIIFGLLGSTIIILYFFAKSHKLNKKQGIFLLFLYALFIAYVIFLSLK